MEILEVREVLIVVRFDPETAVLVCDACREVSAHLEFEPHMYLMEAMGSGLECAAMAAYGPVKMPEAHMRHTLATVRDELRRTAVKPPRSA